MKHLLIVLTAGLLLAATIPGNAAANPLAKLGVGAYGGSNTPIVQDDAESGALFGIRGRVGLLSALAVEPSINFIGSGDADTGEHNPDGSSIMIQAPEITSFAINLVWGGAFYGTAGIGVSKVKLPGVPGGEGETNETTYNFGGGLEIGVGPVAVDISPRLFIINTAEKASRKSLLIMAGVNFYLF